MTTHPAIDIATEQTAVAQQERPVIPLSSWLADAVAMAGRNGQGLQVLSPPQCRITLPLRQVLSGPKARWVVADPAGGGHYDGLSGARLLWDENSGFGPAAGGQPTPDPSPDFLRHSRNPGTQLLVDLRLFHPAADGVRLGGAAETLAQTLGAGALAGWGTSEPALSAWDRDAVTELCRRRAPAPTRLVFCGPGGTARPMVGLQHVSRVTSGVKEVVTFAVGYEPGEQPPLERLVEVAAQFQRHQTLRTMTVQRMAGRADLTYEPRWVGPPIPVATALGARATAEVGLERALAAPIRGRAIGSSRAPAVWYSLGDGTDPEALGAFTALMRYLRPHREAAD
ncbi:DUF6177 family protein [Salinactinospora qingdaonensis]|uniref:Uncharacterized protein n=1 Tax=Salinactinospora qingdaonensis TaxID=702744 RepID=A0ABP7FBG2_9ACTN